MRLKKSRCRLTLAAGPNFADLFFFGGPQTLGGTGEVIFAGTNSINRLYVQGGNTAPTAAILTIGPGILIHGSQGGQLFASFSFDGIVNQGTISAETAARTISLSSVTNEGTVHASAGTFTVSNFAPNAGVIRAGGSGTVAINGALEAGAGTMSIDIGGTVAGQFGHLSVTGAATLSGTLNLATSGGFDPTLGAPFPFLTYGSRTGQFTQVNGNLGPGKQFTVSYGPTTATATVVAAAFAPPEVRWWLVDPQPAFSLGSAASQPFGITALTQTDSGTGFQLQTAPGEHYRLEGTADLLDGEWTTRIERLDGTGHLYQFLDPATLGQPRYFYRFRLVP